MSCIITGVYRSTAGQVMTCRSKRCDVDGPSHTSQHGRQVRQCKGKVAHTAACMLQHAVMHDSCLNAEYNLGDASDSTNA